MPTFITKIPRIDAADAQFIICFRVVDEPIPNVPARILVCRDCLQRVWLADSSPQDRPCVCYQCAIPIIEKDGEEPLIGITEGQAAAAQDHISSVRIQKLLAAGRKKTTN